MKLNSIVNFWITISIFAGMLTTSIDVIAQPQLNFEAASNYSAEHDGVSFLILKEGQIFYEAYANGGGADIAWMTASGTKSFWGVLLAAMVQDDIASLDEPVANTIIEWQSDERKKRITVSQLLSQTDGLTGQAPGPGPVETYAEAVATPSIHEPGEVYSYRPTSWQVFGEWVRRKVTPDYSDAVEYLQARIFDHLEIAPESWPLEADGYPRMPSSSVWTARDWVVFGEFVRLGGNWQGQQLVDEVALDANFVGTDANPAYGLGWWLVKETPQSFEEVIGSEDQAFLNWAATNPVFPEQIYLAHGGGNQRMFIIPEWQMIILRQQRVDGSNGTDFSDINLWRELLDN